MRFCAYPEIETQHEKKKSMKSNPSRYKYTRFLGTALFVVAVSLNLSGVTSNSAKAAAVAADWNTPSTGTIGGVSFSISGLSSPFLAINPNGSFSGPNYAFAPLTDVESIDYGSSNDWSATFASPITDLFIYAGSWRGTFTTGADPSTNYTFSLILRFIVPKYYFEILITLVDY